MNWAIRIIVFSSLVVMLCGGGLSQDEGREQQKEGTSLGGFYFPEWDAQSDSGYVGVFPVSRLSGYHVFGSNQSPLSVGEVSGTPFVFHSGPDYCGWIGLPGFGWFGCGLQPFAQTSGASHDVSSGTKQAIHLTQGMSKEEVLESVGSPSKKILLNTKEIWEYSGYSLLFESGALEEIR